MPDNDSGGEKSELPTPKKLQDARDEGQVAFSSEINTVGILLMGVLAIGFLGPWWWQGMGSAITRSVTEQLMWDFHDGADLRRLTSAYGSILLGLLGFLAIMFTTGAALSLAQVGLHFSAKPLQPKFERLNPLSGMKRIFGMRGLIRTGLGLLKIGMVVFVAWRVIDHDLARQITVDDRVATRLAADCSALWWLAIKLIVLLLVVAFADFLYQRYQHTKDLMMTKQEIKEEFKQSEGDPLVKSKIRQIQRQMAQRRMMQEVPKADVVITNPTHVAVAIRYDRDKMHAPEVIAKGYDGVAQRIKAIAAEHNIPQVENVPLARALAKEVEIGRAVPVKWYEAVAEVLAAVYRIKRGGAGSAPVGAPGLPSGHTTPASGAAPPEKR